MFRCKFVALRAFFKFDLDLEQRRKSQVYRGDFAIPPYSAEQVPRGPRVDDWGKGELSKLD